MMYDWNYSCVSAYQHWLPPCSSSCFDDISANLYIKLFWLESVWHSVIPLISWGHGFRPAQCVLINYQLVFCAAHQDELIKHITIKHFSYSRPIKINSTVLVSCHDTCFVEQTGKANMTLWTSKEKWDHERLAFINKSRTSNWKDSRTISRSWTSFPGTMALGGSSKFGSFQCGY